MVTIYFSMAERKGNLITRPFQPFLLGANDLLRQAFPLYQQIERSRANFANTGNITSVSSIWQLEKTLSIGSFLLKFCGLEALLNCIYTENKVRELKDLPSEYFVGNLSGRYKNIVSSEFERLYLPTRTYLITPLCSDEINDPRKVFDVTGENWYKFLELIDIRHSFLHAASIHRPLGFTKSSNKVWFVNDDFPENFWPLNNVAREQRIFNYKSANDLNSIIDFVIQKLRLGLPTVLDDDFMTKEQIKLSK